MTSCRFEKPASASRAAIRSSSRSPIPTRMPLVHGIRSASASRIVCRRSAGSFVGEPWCATRSGRSDSSISPWLAVTSRSRARSSWPSAPRLVCGSTPRSSARSQHQMTYATKSSKPSAASRSRTPGWCPGSSPVRISSSLTLRRAAPSRSCSTSSGVCRCGVWVANAQYLQCETQVRESDRVTLREKVTRRRMPAESMDPAARASDLASSPPCADCSPSSSPPACSRAAAP